MLLELWRSEGVDTQGVAVDAASPTGIYFVHHGAQGHRFSYRRAGSAASLMTPSGLPESLLRSTAFLHVSGISQAISAGAAATAHAAIQIAHAAGAQVAYDPNLRLKLWPLERAREVILQTMPLCDHFLPSLDDVQLLSGLNAPRSIVAWCHAQGAKTVVLKLGREGSLVSSGGPCVAVAAHYVNAVDATGAGDCFDGSYLHRLALGDEPVAAARWASAAAALATTGYGAVAPLPRSEKIKHLLAQGTAPGA